MKTKTANAIVGWGVVAAIVCVVVGGVVALAWTVETNRCAITKPRTLTGGWIGTDGGMFAKTQAYWLYYKGETGRTGKACKARERVTESEYERVMYGQE